MKKPKKDKPIIPENSNLNQIPQIENEEQLRLSLLQGPDDRASQLLSDKSFDKKNLTYELINGRRTSVNEERETQKRIVSELRKNLEPRFSEYLQAFGDLMGWTEEQRKKYRKPTPTAKVINTIIYNRFPGGVLQHIHAKNPYIKWCLRRYKNYYFLSEDGVLLLEKFIYDAVKLMRECTSLYEFRIKHAAQYGSGFQPDLFKQYFQAI
ncbi:hypothetical protein I2I11_02555 [Pontibacter sp. 172403-2]|uniref:P63C domain-containing protein n=1 Tax=Pontibacter rufus TaxID=2791028 RepID=UPI0018AF7DE3|nr:P63C domain-containing protein [Pontibacter sp. 172403-2]MBF9252165.1 hypothetical protein [Pontibacter sp. 172403-2]